MVSKAKSWATRQLVFPNLRTGKVSHLTSDAFVIAAEIRARVIDLIPSHPVMPATMAGLKSAVRVTDIMQFCNSIES